MTRVFIYTAESIPKHISAKEKHDIISAKAYDMAKKLITEYFGVPYDSIVIKKEKRGKPYIEGQSHIHFNISHCDGAFMIALSDLPVGVDIETMRRFSDYGLKRLFSESELVYINSGEQVKRSITLWTLREAICKADGTGFSDWFYHAELSDGYSIHKTYTYNGVSYTLKTFELTDLAASVACADNETDIILTISKA